MIWHGWEPATKRAVYWAIVGVVLGVGLYAYFW